VHERVGVLAARWMPLLRARSRMTNLGVALLALLTTISMLVNAAYYVSATNTAHRPGSWRFFPGVGGWPGPWAPDRNETRLGPHAFGAARALRVDRPEYVDALDHLIVVPGHAIWKGASVASANHEEAWALENFQRGKGRMAAFKAHIDKGLALYSRSEMSL
jgi:hypothetical protein